MDDLKQIFNKEIDPGVLDANKLKKQQKGFTTTGAKGLSLIDRNLIQIYEINSSVEYTMGYLQFLKIVNVMGFDEEKLELGLSKLNSDHYLILDFNTKKVMFYDNKEAVNLIGQNLTQAKQIHTNNNDNEGDEYNKEIYSEWYNELTKN